MSNDCHLLLAPECGGSHNLPLFCGETKGNDTEYCNVDAMVVRNGSVRFLLEIEESGFLPTKVCGKFLTSALSSHFVHDVLNNAATAFAPNATFVQVMDSSKFEERSKKVKQGAALELSIKSILPLRAISSYRLFFFEGVRAFATDSPMRLEFQELFTMASCA